MRDGIVSAIVLNSGGANCHRQQRVPDRARHGGGRRPATRRLGRGRACLLHRTDRRATRPAVKAGVWDATLALETDAATSPEAGLAAAEAIMTTDTRPKQATHLSPAGWSIGGMAKGAGMLAPGLATMLVVLTTDAVLDSAALDAALRQGDRRHLRPPRLRWLHVHQRHRQPARLRGERHRGGPGRVRGCPSPRGLPGPHPAAAGRRGGRGRTTSRSRCGTRHPRPARSSWRAPSQEQPVQGGHLRQGPQLGPGARRGRHGPCGRGCVRPVPESTSR